MAVEVNGRSQQRQATRNRRRTHEFVQELYKTFYPLHLKRIQDALAAMPDPRKMWMTSSMSIEDIESRLQDQSASSSRDTASFKKPNTPASKQQKDEMTMLREQFVEQSKEKMALLSKQLTVQEG